MKNDLDRIEKRVLITAIGSFSASAVIKSLRAAGLFVAGCDIYPENWVVNSRSCNIFRKAPLGSDSGEYISFIENYCRDLRLSYVFPLTDPEVDVLSEHSEELKKKGITVCVPSPSAVRKVRDKFSFSLISEDVSHMFENVRCIPTCYLKDMPEDHPLPAVIKPVSGRSSIGKQIISSREDLKALRDLPEYSGHILQPHIPGNIVTADILRDTFGNTVIYARRELLRTVSGAGICVETMPDFPAKAFCEKLAETIGIVGCVNIEFVEEERADMPGSFIYRPLEINPRFSGGIEFSCLAGCDFPLAAFKIFESENEKEPFALPKDITDSKKAVYSRSYTTYEM